MARKQPPVKTGDEVVLEIENYASEGEGVARIEGFTVFVPGALVGEKVVALIHVVKKTYARAHLVDDGIRIASPDRVAPPCPLYPDCGGCQLLHLSYEGQLAMKQQRVVDALARIGGLTDVVVHPIIGMSNPWHYRNRAQYPFGMSNGNIIAGCYRKGTHEVVETSDCLIQHPMNNRVTEEVKRLAKEFGLSVYDEETHKGHLRYVLVRRAFGTGEISVVLVTNGSHFPDGKGFAKSLASKFPGIRSIVQNVNRIRGNKVLGDENIVLWGEDGIVDILGDLRFKISATAFYQVNPVQTLVLYQKAVEYARLSGEEKVVDIYCGVGTLTLFLAEQALEVYGIEANKDAIEDANENAKLNGITNVRFISGRAEEVVPDLAKEGITFDVAVLDPPRTGCQPEVLEALADTGPQRIVYVSCNPSTLARDLKMLTLLGYRTEEVQPVDMFPHTYHVETIARIQRADS
ncbi:MAG: 23S rRNA (uracil(1939)-C(5))-methyltransferase RlmD [Bacillota bacterium]|jgi:23S rRNA (uracil1939-C5)-methyltransferase